LKVPSRLRSFDPLRKVGTRLEASESNPHVPGWVKTELHGLYEILLHEIERYDFGPECFVHGDAHTGNLLISENQAFMLDWEDASRGPSQWDLSVIALTYFRFKMSARLLASFEEAYGSAIMEAPSCQLLLRCREMTTTSWLTQNAHDPKALEEVEKRVRSIRDSDDSIRWNAF